MSVSRAVVAALLFGACGSLGATDPVPPAEADASGSAVREANDVTAPTPERREYWRVVARKRGIVPQGSTAAELAIELDPWLASTDPELRDDLAYTILASWIVRGRIEDDALRGLAAKWRADLGRTGTRDEDVVARSFAALTLAAVGTRELQHPFLGEEVALLCSAALKYAASEHDVRGFDPTLGWVHATAHTADLLQSLARLPDLAVADQAAFLAVLDAKSALPRATWTAGEDLRLARVALSLVNRADFERETFERWIVAYETAHRHLWAAPRVDGDRLAEFGNRRRVLVELYALLADYDVAELAVWAHDRTLRALRATG